MGTNLKLSSSSGGTRNAPANSKNLVVDFGGVGDGQRNTAINITVATASPTLVVGTSVFVPGDVGKAISIWSGSSYKNTTIAGYTSATKITLGSNAGFDATAVSSEILWGTDNTNAFVGSSGSWRAWAQTQTNLTSPPVLYIPDGNFVYLGGNLSQGILNNTRISGLSGTAANCKLMNLGNGELRFGTNVPIVANRGYNATQTGGNSVRLATASQGATTTSVVSYNVTAADGSRFDSRIVVGRACLLSCFDTQGGYETFFGYPPNNHFYEWNVIQAYNSSTGVITFQSPLTQGYKSTYPRWGLENTQFGSDQGGVFTMWVASDDYNYTTTLENFTVDSPRNQCATHRRYVVLNNLTMNGPGLYPTQCDTFTATNCTYPSQLEVDKMVGTVTWNNCSHVRLEQQSSSPNRSILNGGTIGTLEFAKYTEANSVTFTGSGLIRNGVAAFGRSDTAVLTNCTGIAQFTRSGAITDDLNGSSGTGAQQDASTYYSFVSGVIKFPKTSDITPGNSGQQNLTRWAVPGTWVSFDDKYFDQVSDVSDDGTYIYITFANTTNWPFTPVSRLRDVGCPNMTFINCTGTAKELEDFNNINPNTAYLTRINRTYTETLGTSSGPGALAYGQLTATDAISINVSTAYTGASALTWKPTAFTNQFFVWRAGAQTTLNLAINAKITGNRVYNGATQTWSGSQTGDSLPVIQSGDVLLGNYGPTLSTSVSGQGLGPVINFAVKTNQGF